MEATVTVFDTETHFDFFEPDARVIEKNVYKNNYAANLGRAIDTIMDMELTITGQYAEVNEFGQPVTCYFVNSHETAALPEPVKLKPWTA